MTTHTTTINASCTDDDLALGSIVNVAFDGRGLARITGHEDDGIHIITFIDDPARTSEHVSAGESVGCTRADMTVMHLAAAPAEACDVENEEGATTLTFTVAADVTLTVTLDPDKAFTAAEWRGFERAAARRTRRNAQSALRRADDLWGARTAIAASVVGVTLDELLADDDSDREIREDLAVAGLL
jgi:antitoxin (DNA-binding transcriptional repressor) of toxin-antitoxin stability system